MVKLVCSPCPTKPERRSSGAEVVLVIILPGETFSSDISFWDRKRFKTVKITVMISLYRTIQLPAQFSRLHLSVDAVDIAKNLMCSELSTVEKATMMGNCRVR